MREFSVPASVRVDDGDTLSDTVFALADEHPGAVALRRRVDDAWATSPTPRSPRRSSPSPAA